jgi:signal transduction histidine kinase
VERQPWWRRVQGVFGNPWLIDSALVLFVVVIALAQQFASVADEPATHATGLTFAAVLPLVLVLRRRAPILVLATMLAILGVWTATGAATSGAGIPVMVGLYSVAAYRPVLVSSVLAVLTAVGILGVQAQSIQVTSNLVEVVASCAGAWWLGANAQTRRSQRDALAAYAEELADTRERLAQQRVAEERLRIAREMHDVVAHSLGVVAVQAGVADHLLQESPEQARDSVATIKKVARVGLQDMRRTLGVLRSEEGPSEREAAPGLANVPQLVDDITRGSQLDVDLCVTGEAPTALAPALQLSVYRVVQEALTNACKHAPGSRVTVDLRYGPDDVDVEIVDDGSTTPLGLPGSGNGLVGMRERVGMFGGTFEATRRIGGGFRVAARFPIAGGTA